MKCTDCGRPVRPVVAIDIDGTLGDYHAHFIRFSEDWLGQPLPNYDFEVNCGLTTYTWRQIKLAYRQGGMKRTMPPLGRPGLMSLAIARTGAEIWVTTTRPYNRLDNIDPDTQEWLRRNGVAYDYVIYDPDKYEELAQLVGADRVVAVLEDLPNQAERASRLFGAGAVVLRHNGYSNARHVSKFFRARNLDAAERYIISRIGDWNASKSLGAVSGSSSDIGVQV